MPEDKGYCVKCREKRVIKNPVEQKMKNGRLAMKGVCSVCGTKMFRIMGKAGKYELSGDDYDGAAECEEMEQKIGGRSKSRSKSSKSSKSSKRKSRRRSRRSKKH